MKTAINNLLWLILWVLSPAAMAGEGRPSRDEAERLWGEGFRKVAGREQRTVDVSHDQVAAITKELAGEPFLDALAKVLPIARSRLDSLGSKGFGTLFHDAEMARILREKHGIEWKSSSQLRPWRHQ